MDQAIVVGSLSDVAKRSGQSIAESFIGAEMVVIVDCSGSMNQRDSRDGRSRHEVALEELAQIQADMPSKVAVIAFSDMAIFVPGGQPPLLHGGTNLAGALRFAKAADVPDVLFVVISDGEPDNQDEALAVARTFTQEISTVYVGPESDPRGRDFLKKLAKMQGGRSVTADRAQELASKVVALLE